MGAARSRGRAGAPGGQGRGFRAGRRGGEAGAGQRAHLKSLSLDVIFSRRLEMWKAAVLMVSAPRGRRREGIWRRGAAPSPAARGLRSANRNSRPRPAPPRGAALASALAAAAGGGRREAGAGGARQ